MNHHSYEPELRSTLPHPAPAGAGLSARLNRVKTGLPPQNICWPWQLPPAFPTSQCYNLLAPHFQHPGPGDLGLALSWPPSPLFRGFSLGCAWWGLCALRRPHLQCFKSLPLGLLHLLDLLKQTVLSKIYLNPSFVLKKVTLCSHKYWLYSFSILAFFCKMMICS